MCGPASIWAVMISAPAAAKDKWRCEDECLTNVATKGNNAPNTGGNQENLLCGQTGHLTNFALLLIGNDGEDPCQSGGKSNTLAWISLGMVGGAMLVVALSVLAVEVHFRWRQSQFNRKLSKAYSQRSGITASTD